MWMAAPMKVSQEQDAAESVYESMTKRLALPQNKRKWCIICLQWRVSYLTGYSIDMDYLDLGFSS